MKPVSVKQLLSKLSSIGLESLEVFNNKNRGVSDTIGSLCSGLLQLKGEASSIAIAEEILEIYQSFTPAEKLEFFHYINRELASDPATVDQAIDRYRESRSQQDLQKLAKAVESPRLDLFRALNMAPNGTHVLVAMREDLLRVLKSHPELNASDEDMLHLFVSWFNRGFLVLRRIDWQTPAMVLEQLIDYESVHEIQGWPDLRRRLEADRRCFAFFHPVMPDVPLIFVEVALTKGISDNIAALLNQPPPRGKQEFDTAIFYSINNCLGGLRGVSFGNFLIKQVIEKVAAEMPSVKAYSTLSPIPGFMNWLQENLDELDFVDVETRDLLHRLLVSPDPRLLDNELSRLMLPRLCAWYLMKAKSRNKPADPVARFHLGNGARLERINWGADTSVNGMQQSAGLMVNYLYDRATLARNHEAYQLDNRVIASPEVIKLLP